MSGKAKTDPTKSSRYTGVSYSFGSLASKVSRWRVLNEKKPWKACVVVFGAKVRRKKFATERDAAIQYDKWVLELGLDRPLNILKRKSA